MCVSVCVRARTPPEPTLRTRLRQNDYVLGLGVNDPIGAAFVLHAHAPAAPGSLLGLDQPDRRVERVVAQPDELNNRPFVPNRMRMERSRIKTRAMRGVPRTCALEIKLAEWAPAQVPLTFARLVTSTSDPQRRWHRDDGKRRVARRDDGRRRVLGTL